MMIIFLVPMWHYFDDFAGVEGAATAWLSKLIFDWLNEITGFVLKQSKEVLGSIGKLLGLGIDLSKIPFEIFITDEMKRKINVWHK